MIGGAELLDKYPNYKSAQHQQAECLYKLGRYVEAQSVYQIVLETNPKTKGAIIGLARIAEHSENWKEAEKQWKK